MTTISNNNNIVNSIWKDRIERALKYICRTIDLKQRDDAVDAAKAMLVKYHIGILETNSLKNNVINGKHMNSERDIFLDQKNWNTVTLMEKIVLNHDSVRLTFALKHPHQKLGVPTGKHLYLRCISSSGKKVVRAFTPTSTADQVGKFDLIVKLYRASGNWSGGKMSACIDRLKPGDTVECKGPFGDFEYQTGGTLVIKNIAHQVSRFTMIAGGSGITGIYPILRSAHKDGIKCHVVDCNKTEVDILMRQELDGYKEVSHCLSRPTNGWKGRSGYISKALIGPVHDGFLLCCGPTGMMESVLKIAEIVGWDIKKQVIFL
ncbi:unnamed protein product [Rotaria sp. Silwood1]|nr:unnamed protein product [Rotaria sp. Silwood1]